MATLTNTPSSLDSALNVLKGRASRKIGHNTELRAVGGEVFATYHGNPIVRYATDGIYATYAGWATSTTTNRLNQLAPARFNIKGREPHINGEKLEDWSAWVKVS